jgi:hypothetical protein
MSPVNRPGSPPTITIVDGAVPLPELPVSPADLIALGQITSITPRIIPTTQGVYSEYHVDTIGTAILNKSGRNSPTFDMLQLGGSAQLPDGRVVRHQLRGLGKQLEVKTYLMFLKYQAYADCFTIIKLWEVENGIVLAVGNDDLYRASHNTSTVYGLPVQGVIGRIQAAVAAAQQ